MFWVEGISVLIEPVIYVAAMRCSLRVPVVAFFADRHQIALFEEKVQITFVVDDVVNHWRIWLRRFSNQKSTTAWPSASVAVPG